jgi:hypothetical protein
MPPNYPSSVSWFCLCGVGVDTSEPWHRSSSGALLAGTMLQNKGPTTDSSSCQAVSEDIVAHQEAF